MTYEYRYPRPSVTVDTVIFTIGAAGREDARLDVLLIERRDPPFAGTWALPGGFVDVSDSGDQGESVEQAAARELTEETGLETERDGVYLEQLYTFGDPGRDPRGRVISVAYFALVSPEARGRVRAGDDASDARWFDVEALVRDRTPLAFDHDRVLAAAVARIRGKLDYEPRLARALLPSEFTQKQFRRVHEIVKGTTYDRSNFARRFRRMVEDGRLQQSEARAELPGSGRPPRLYRFAE
jgi:8-oxo-dGTP diphosphatase